MMARYCPLLILLLVLVRSGYAVEPTPGQLLRRSPWVRWEVAAGRLVLPTLSAAPHRTFTAEGRDATESLTINSSGDDASLSYRFETAERELTIEHRGNDLLTLRDVTKDNSFELSQASKQVRVRYVQNGSPVEQRFDSLWHLLLFSPEATEVLLPRLELLKPDWGLEGQAAEIRECLFESLDGRWRSEQQNWQQGVSDLASADYATRQAADRKLRAGGTAAAAFLRSIDATEFEPEQLRRLERIMADVVSSRDEPASVAASLTYDTRVWWLLLGDEQEDRRRASAQHLSELLRRPIRFDPSANVAVRETQIKAIESTLLRK